MLDLKSLRPAVRAENGVSRRLFLSYSAALSSLPLLGARVEARTRRIVFSSDPFTVGVASGDPLPSGVVLWTRLAPKPLEPDGGLPPEAIEVAWEIASDESMNEIVQRGTAVATPQLGHSVHVEVEGLKPDRWYWYRFRVRRRHRVPIGRALAPCSAIGTPNAGLSSGWPSPLAQHYEAGLFHRIRTHGQGRTRPGLSPGRLHLRDTLDTKTSSPQARSARKILSL